MDIANYNENRGKYSSLSEHNNAVYGFWLIGRWYNVRKGKPYYYGAYPPSYLERLELLFPKEFKGGKILHLFSGTIEGDNKRVFTMDINPEPVPGIKPNVVGNVEEIDRHFQKRQFNLILADPPYGENYKKYGTSKINRKKIVSLCSRILCGGGVFSMVRYNNPAMG